MSTKEMAYSIIDQLGEEELQGFITLFRRLYPPKENLENGKQEHDEMAERRAAFERMKNACRYIPNLDEKQELAEYREEKYGNESAD